MTISINQYLYKETLHMEGIRIGNALSPRTTLFPNTPFFILALAAPVPDIRNRESFVFPVVPFLEPRRGLNRALNGAILGPRHTSRRHGVGFTVDEMLMSMDS